MEEKKAGLPTPSVSQVSKALRAEDMDDGWIKAIRDADNGAQADPVRESSSRMWAIRGVPAIIPARAAPAIPVRAASSEDEGSSDDRSLRHIAVSTVQKAAAQNLANAPDGQSIEHAIKVVQNQAVEAIEENMHLKKELTERAAYEEDLRQQMSRMNVGPKFQMTPDELVEFKRFVKANWLMDGVARAAEEHIVRCRATEGHPLSLR
jgi:hypothetical protein